MVEGLLPALPLKQSAEAGAKSKQQPIHTWTLTTPSSLNLPTIPEDSLYLQAISNSLHSFFFLLFFVFVVVVVVAVRTACD